MNSEISSKQCDRLQVAAIFGPEGRSSYLLVERPFRKHSSQKNDAAAANPRALSLYIVLIVGLKVYA